MMMTYWSKEETFKLIRIWSEDNIQAQLEGCKRNREVYTKISCELFVAGYTRTYEQCREKLKKLKAEYKRIRDKRQETGQGRYPEWDYYDAMNDVLGHKPSTQPAVVVDTLEDSQVQDTQVDDDELQQTDMITTPTSLDTSDISIPSPASADVTDASGEVATTSQGQKKEIDGADKVPSRKWKKSKLDVTGELLDKLIGMQRRENDMELEMKRAQLEEKQMDMQMRKERQFQLQMMNIMIRNSHSTLPPGPSYPAYGYGGYDPDATQDDLL